MRPGRRDSQLFPKIKRPLLSDLLRAQSRELRSSCSKSSRNLHFHHHRAGTALQELLQSWEGSIFSRDTPEVHRNNRGSHRERSPSGLISFAHKRVSCREPVVNHRGTSISIVALTPLCERYCRSGENGVSSGGTDHASIRNGTHKETGSDRLWRAW